MDGDDKNMLQLYDLAGANVDLRFSPHCWKTRMALAHKGLQTVYVPWRFRQKDSIAFSGQGMVPVLVHDKQVVSDSWQIALHLDRAFPEHPLFESPAALASAHFVNSWVDTVLIPLVASITMLDVWNILHVDDKAYFRETREKRFGTTLENLTADQAGNIQRLRQSLAPLQRTLRQHPFLSGETPAYADYSVFGVLMWARCCSGAKLLEVGDVVYAWRERLLNAFDGFARSAPCIECDC
ncbi:glutathione S-transferase N-terminal domain-containing protein [Nevskia soli]|uniref:glutathione S-transferase N-terminal domain-containing protein n=1 Tax=Nevskia soli TaxID=418856 RepID=UPI001B80AFB3|nr:glutathione S-transferase N-terminal domain-containing protein [Nevskia soli]